MSNRTKPPYTGATVTLINNPSTAAQTVGTTGATLAPFTAGGAFEQAQAVAASAIDCSAATFFTKTISALTTFTVSKVPAAGTVVSFILELTNGGAFTVTWWANIKWAAGAAPSLTAAGVDVLGFYTLDGGVTWRGVVVGKNMS